MSEEKDSMVEPEVCGGEDSLQPEAPSPAVVENGGDTPAQAGIAAAAEAAYGEAQAAKDEDVVVKLSALRELETKSAEYLELAQRQRAELENFRKRVARDRESEKLAITAGLVRQILNPVDNLSRAISAGEKDQSFENLYQGLKMVDGELWKIMTALGVERLACAGAQFDPRYQEALMQIPSDKPKNIVVEEVGPGYKMGELCLRPAKVVVSAGQPEANPQIKPEEPTA